MNDLGPFLHILDALDNIKVLPEMLSSTFPGRHWQPIGPVTNVTTKKLQIYINQLTQDALDARNRGDFKTGSELDSEKEIWEHWLRHLICKEFSLFGIIHGNPVICGRWMVAYQPVEMVPLMKKTER